MELRKRVNKLQNGEAQALLKEVNSVRDLMELLQKWKGTNDELTDLAVVVGNLDARTLALIFSELGRVVGLQRAVEIESGIYKLTDFCTDNVYDVSDEKFTKVYQDLDTYGSTEEKFLALMLSKSRVTTTYGYIYKTPSTEELFELKNAEYISAFIESRIGGVSGIWAFLSLSDGGAGKIWNPYRTKGDEDTSFWFWKGASMGRYVEVPEEVIIAYKQKIRMLAVRMAIEYDVNSATFTDILQELGNACDDDPGKDAFLEGVFAIVSLFALRIEATEED